MRRALVLLITVLVPAIGAYATETAAESPRLTLERIFSRPSLAGDLPRQHEWRPIFDTWTHRRGDELIQVVPSSGETSVLVAGEELPEVGDGEARHRPPLAGCIFRPDGMALLLQDDDELYLYDLPRASLTTLATGAGHEEEMQFSPTGKHLAYVRNNNLYVYDFEHSRETAVTSDGSDTIHNGILDWIYWEELSDRTGTAFHWSADGTSIIWLRLDDSPIPPFHLVDTSETHSSLRIQYNPKPGDPQPVPSLHVVNLVESGELTRTANLTFEDEAVYIPRFGFTPDNTSIWYQKLDHAQDRLELRRFDPASGDDTLLVAETDPYWVEPVDMMHLFDDGSLLWASRRSGWMHLYRIDADGTATDLTPGNSEVTDLVGVAEDGSAAWYQAARPSPLERRLFRVALADGSTTELTTELGSHRGSLSPSASWLMVTSSRFDRPAHIELYRAGGGHIRTVIDPPTEELDKIRLGNARFLSITSDDGLELNAMLLVPADFDPKRSYPVVVFTYGGPHAQVVRNAWGRTTHMYHHYLVQQGFLVFALDNRGAANQGREFEGAADQRLGSSQLQDQLAGVRWLKKQPYVDGDHIGIWGWSYGGYMAAFALTRAPGVFAAGVAVAPVTDWRLYDSIYTERYMGTPESNPEGYEAGSVLAAAGALEDPLLVIHGTADDNVHLQHTLQLVDRAWRAGKRFDLMLFPELAHGIRDTGSHLQLFGRITDFFEEHLK